eukprot:1236195-Amphidinium_carterae.1
MGAPEALKVYECQAYGCTQFTCIRCAVPLQLTNCRQGLLCSRHFPYPKVAENDEEAEDFWDNQPHNHHLSFKEINMSYAFMYMPLTRDEAMAQEIQLTDRCCACQDWCCVQDRTIHIALAPCMSADCSTTTISASAVTSTRDVMSYIHTVQGMLFAIVLHHAESWIDGNENMLA